MFSLIPQAIAAVTEIIHKNVADAQARTTIISKLITILQGNVKAVYNDTAGTWMQRNWRPTLMFIFIFIIGWDYVIYQFMHFYHVHVPFLLLPPDMWKFVWSGFGGYGTARTAEKIASMFAK